MTTASAGEVQTVDNPADVNAALIEQVVMMGDLSKLTAAQRIDYYRLVCESAGLNPLTAPLQFLTLNGKLVLYAGKNAAEQIRRNNGISITKLERDQSETTYDVTAYAMDKTGRMDAAIGSVNIGGLRGEALSNAKMKAETKAKRRVTLSMSGLGLLDETEVGSIPGAMPTSVDLETGEIIASTQTEVKTLREIALEAQAASEGPQEPAPAPAADEVDADTVPLFPEALSVSETLGFKSPEDLTDDEFRKLCRAARIFTADVKATAARLFPDAKSSADLTDAQRGQLWIVLATEQGQ